MDDHRKRAYRYLLYWAMLEIRPIAWLRLRTLRLLNPWHWRNEVRRIRGAGAIADWLHNLALFSALDFARFDEARFWGELDDLIRRHPEYELGHYRNLFEQELEHFPEAQPPR